MFFTTEKVPRSGTIELKRSKTMFFHSEEGYEMVWYNVLQVIFLKMNIDFHMVNVFLKRESRFFRLRRM